MAKTVKLEVRDQNPLTALEEFFTKLLREGECTALLVARHLPMKHSVMPVLISDPTKVAGADPLAPVFPINAAKVVSRLTRKPLGGKVAVVLRPCEIRAFVELVKLKQGSMEEIVLVGMDCLGAYTNINYPRFAGDNGREATLKFYRNMREGKGTAWDDFDLSPACKACEHPIPEGADLSISLVGVDLDREVLLQARTARGELLLDALSLPETTEPAGRQEAVATLLSERRAYRDRMFQETSEATADLNKLTAYLANCVNCYNCRVACPVCYCKECVFVTDVFDHEPSQYLRWAQRKGILKMPTDTVFYHITRLAHMSTACVGCGQCSNACPNNVPVMELFRTIAWQTQRAFDYEAGRNLAEDPPLSVFREHEFPEVTGGKD
jgi:formate dehydrogenase (coenzyme F420) beta subunit